MGDVARHPGASLLHHTLYAFRIRCLLHALHLSANAGMVNPFFMGPLGEGAWHNWPRQHVVSLLGIIWYNTIGRCQHDLAAVQDNDSKLSSISSPPPILPVQLGLRACPLQHASSAVIRPPIRPPYISSTDLSNDCHVRRLFRPIVELRLPQRIEQRPRHVLASRRCSAAATFDNQQAARLITLISANDLPVQAASSSLYLFVL